MSPAQAEVVFRGSATGVTTASREAVRGISSVEKSADRGAKQITSMGTAAQKQQGKLTQFARSGAAAFGAAGLAFGIKKSIDAFKDAEVQMARVRASLHTLGVDNDATRKKIENVTLAQQRLSGFQDDDLQRSFATIFRSVKDVNRALQINATVADFARGSGKDLNTVATAFAKLTDGNTNALARYGIKAEKGATVTEVLAKAQKRYSGQAAAYGKTVAGQADIAAGEWNNLQEAIGSKFAPAANAASGAIINITGAVTSLSGAIGGVGPLIAGAAGIGAFRIATPLIGEAAGALKTFGLYAQAGGGGLKGVGRAAASMVTPMGAATVGVGLLAAGLYTAWHTAQSTDQAIQALNASILGTTAAADQKAVAKNQVNSAQDYVKATKASEKAARAHATALHGERQALIENVAALKVKGAKSTEVEAAQKKVTAKEKEWKKALDDVIPAVHARQTAQQSLTSAQANLANATDAARVAGDKQAANSDNIIGKIEKQASQAQRLAGNWREVGKNTAHGGDEAASAAERARRGAAIWAASFDRSAAATRRSNSAVSKVDSNLASVARTLGRIPSNKEIRIIARMTAAQKSLDAIIARLGAIQSKNISLRFNATFGNVPNAVTGLTAAAQRALDAKLHPPKNPSATGAWVAGNYSAGDRVPALLSGEEAVLNPEQQDLVDSGMTVRQALAATGAPVIGNGFAKGKKPHYVYSSLKGVKRTTKTPTEQARAAIEKRRTFFALQLAKSDQAVVNAAGTESADDDIAALTADIAARRAERDWIGKVLRNPGKALGFPGARLGAKDRTDLIGEQTAQTSAMNDDARQIYDLQNPDVADSGGSGATNADGSPIDTGPTPDQQAISEQLQARLAVATRSASLSEAELAALRSSGDIGTGGFGNALQSGAGLMALVTLGDPRSVAAVASTAVKGIAAQPAVSATRDRIGI